VREVWRRKEDRVQNGKRKGVDQSIRKRALPCGSDDAAARKNLGLKFDGGKLRYDLVDDDAEAEFVAVLTFGAEQYAPDNWRLLPDLERRFFAALRRHLREYRKGNVFDSQTGLLHLAHAASCLHFLLGAAFASNPKLAESFDARFADAVRIARESKAKRIARKKN
jgi:hypothetical protein